MEKKIPKRLVFVYNANSGARNALMDSMHKVFSPSTYYCKLCDITFGVVTENRTWRKFRQQSEYQMTFLHKDEFAKKYASKFGYKFEFPIVLVEGEKGLEVLITTQEVNELKTAQGLIRLLKERTLK
ncbi:GTPase [uncultured Croceitalea sp.]|uniref:GTPase n=1 Tax=uncultured Croceitalea sp. TaxID=1798908 RepID=UPI003306842F